MIVWLWFCESLRWFMLWSQLFFFMLPPWLQWGRRQAEVPGNLLIYLRVLSRISSCRGTQSLRADMDGYSRRLCLELGVQHYFYCAWMEIYQSASQVVKQSRIYFTSRWGIAISHCKFNIAGDRRDEQNLSHSWVPQQLSPQLVEGIFCSD